ESERLPGGVYTKIVLGGQQLVRASHTAGSARYIEIYSPINLARGQNYTLALPFIVQGRQIEAQVNDLATTIYMLLVFIVLGAIACRRCSRTSTPPSSCSTASGASARRMPRRGRCCNSARRSSTSSSPRTAGGGTSRRSSSSPSTAPSALSASPSCRSPRATK